MKKIIVGFLLTVLVGCGVNRSPPMTIETFQKSHVGMSEEALRKMYGDPVNIYYLDNGTMVYEYRERLMMMPSDRNFVEVRRYYFKIKDGRVVSKQISVSNSPPYDFMDEY